MLGIPNFYSTLEFSKLYFLFFQSAALDSTFKSPLFLTIFGADTQRREMVKVCKSQNIARASRWRT